MESTTKKKTISKKCPKCGFDDVYIRYYPIGEYMCDEEISRSCEDFVEPEKDNFCKKWVFVKECLRIVCRTCGYSWGIKPINRDRD